ncbi:hypothetical protein ACRALDRAFT_1059384 [Sodiomyces alcalophilus JCM 7366]|uniref:uncharacterized protein n=1 Tax=Sodiomyces alcalophilus JCM 7366 TaxID=591952 RepID=UPI0039B3C2DF
MEEQKASAQHSDPDSYLSADTQPHPTRPLPLSSSEPTLRFPRPQGNRQLASWIFSSQPDVMTPSADTPGDIAGVLSESSYEFIHTDDESQDGPASESIHSFDYSRADDVHSLAGTEQSVDDLQTDSESESDSQETGEREGAAEEEEQARNNSQVYVEESLSNPSTPASASIIGPAADTHSPVGSAVTPSLGAWESQDSSHFQHVPSEDKPVGQNSTPEAPQPCIATVYQHMDDRYLRIKEPIRIMYVGSPDVQEDIINKIVSALTAPVYFWPDEAEFKRTHLKVGHCTFAQATFHISADGMAEKTYSITIDGEKTYNTVVHWANFQVKPRWEVVPNFALFYASKEDDTTACTTRDAAWHFMRLHRVPCILISDSHNPADDSLEKYIDIHAIHRRLDPVTHHPSIRRAPVDLTSFLNADSGKLNRHLAYLSRVYTQPPEDEDGELFAHARETAGEIGRYMLNRCRAMSPLAVVHLLLLAITTVAVYSASQYIRGATTPTPPAGAVQQPLTSAPSVARTATSQDSMSTVSSNLTSTTVVEIPRANATPNHLALAPFPNLFSESATGSQESTVCSAEIHGRNGILVKIPLSTKTTWLAKDSISIDVLRGDKLVKTKFSSIDEGLLIEIPRSQAYGPISVTVVTSRRPKVNETHQVDFGKSAIETVVDFGRHLAGGVAKAAESLTDAAGEAPERVLCMKDLLLEELTDLGERARAETLATRDYIRNAWSKSEPMAKQWVRAREDAVRHILHHMEDHWDRMDLSVRTAQIASRCWWLRMQGKREEHDAYLGKAKVYLAGKYSEAVKARQLRHQTKPETRPESACRSWAWSKKCLRGDK